MPEGRIPRLLSLTPLLLLTALACADPLAPELAGQWGGPDATLILSPAGGTVEYACGSGTIEPGWVVGPDGSWAGRGEYFMGGGPLPSEGRPPHDATYAGRVERDVLTFTVVVPDLGATLGPYTVRRGEPGASEICL